MKPLHDYPTPLTDAERRKVELGLDAHPFALLLDLERKLALCREVLVPFASLLHDHHDGCGDDWKIFGINDSVITLGDIRRANAATAPTP